MTDDEATKEALRFYRKLTGLANEDNVSHYAAAIACLSMITDIVKQSPNPKQMLEYFIDMLRTSCARLIERGHNGDDP